MSERVVDSQWQICTIRLYSAIHVGARWKIPDRTNQEQTLQKPGNPEKNKIQETRWAYYTTLPGRHQVWRPNLQCQSTKVKVSPLSRLAWVTLPVHHPLNIWEFVYFLCGLSPPKRRVVRRRNFASRRVPIMCRTCARFYVYRDRRKYENSLMTFFNKKRASRQDTCDRRQ